MKLAKIFYRLAAIILIFDFLSAVIVLLILWFVHFDITLNPLRLEIGPNHPSILADLVHPTQIVPTPTLLPTYPPADSAHITNVVGHAQLYTLDCEARSAVDLAAFFGVPIDEKEFLNKMPHSTNPNLGFVGNFTDPVGKLPPLSYGIYAGPIAAMLRSYGLKASDQHMMSFDGIRSEVSSGHPVMVWVSAHTETGWATSYVTPDGQKIPVTPFEHTVIVTGYDASYVDILDGNSTYQRLKVDFLKSWGNLGNMAVTIAK